VFDNHEQHQSTNGSVGVPRVVTSTV
jgi:hypothetical protein